MNLTPVQQQIVDTPGNLIVRASAGTGKTHTMVAKIATEIEHNHTHKSIAAITFTIKAAQEIKDRLTIDSSRHFIGTNNSFVIEEITPQSIPCNWPLIIVIGVFNSWDAAEKNFIR